MGRLPTTDHLFNINLGPDTPCALCGLHRETIEHLFVSCPKIQPVWNYLSTRTNRNISFPDNFLLGLGLPAIIILCLLFHSLLLVPGFTGNIVVMLFFAMLN